MRDTLFFTWEWHGWYPTLVTATGVRGWAGSWTRGSQSMSTVVGDEILWRQPSPEARQALLDAHRVMTLDQCRERDRRARGASDDDLY